MKCKTKLLYSLFITNFIIILYALIKDLYLYKDMNLSTLILFLFLIWTSFNLKKCTNKFKRTMIINLMIFIFINNLLYVIAYFISNEFFTKIYMYSMFTLLFIYFIKFAIDNYKYQQSKKSTK